MTPFKMGTVERQLLADIGKLYLFVWRTRNLGSLESLPKDIRAEYDEIIKNYGRSAAEKDPHTQIYRILRDIASSLENDMKNLDRHFAVTLEVRKGLIISVECCCGELTKYRVPLKLIDDFKCPKERR